HLASTFAARHLKGLHPLRCNPRCIFFVECLAVNAIGITLQRYRPMAGVRQKKPRASLIVRDYIAFCEFARWVQDLFRIGYCNLVSRTRAAANHDFGELSANVSRK